jgi:ribosome recycling factor
MTRDDVLMDSEERMEKAVGNFQHQLQGIRTGRATSGLVDSIKVDYYGSQTPIKQLGSITVQDGTQIVIRPFDAGALGAIGKAIQNSDVGLAPNSDGRVIRLNVPPLSTERRKQMVARVKELAEEARVAIRNIRRDGNKHADTLEKDSVITEDDLKALKEEVQELTKTYEGKVNSLAAAKDKEVMGD